MGSPETMAVLGGAAGFAVGGPAGAAVGASIGGQLGAAGEAGDAAEKAGQAQLQAAREGIAFQKETREKALAFAEPSVQELKSIQQLSETRLLFLNEQLGNINKQQELLNAVDPALKEAGNQALQLLQGKEAASLSPIKNERQRKRQALENQLAQRLGPGFRSSSAGIEALNRFDDSTDTLLTQAQQSTLNTLLQTSLAARPDVGLEFSRLGQLQSAFLGQEISARQNIPARQVSAISGTPVNFGQVVQTAGAPFQGDISKAQTKQQAFGALGQVGGIALGQQFGGTPTTAPSPTGQSPATFGNIFGQGR